MPIARDISWKKNRRIESSLGNIGLPEVLLFGRYNYLRAGPSLPTHAHDQAMELCFLVRGRQLYRVGGRSYQLKGGDTFITFPGEVHDTAGTPEEKGILYWLIVRLSPRGKKFLGLNGNRARALHGALKKLSARYFRSNRATRSHLDSIARRLQGPMSHLDAVAVHNHLISLLLGEIDAAQTADSIPRGPAITLENLARLIETDLAQPPSLPHLARIAGLSLPRFKAWFKEQTGVPPGEYILRQRVEEACQRLKRPNVTITNVCYELGFSSSQYFATVIKRFTGLTPRQLRKT